MTLPSRPSDFDARFLRHLVGTKATTFYDFDPLQQPSPVSLSTSATSAFAAPLLQPPATSAPPASLATAPSISFFGSPPLGFGRSWIITEKFSERAVHLTQEEVDMGVGLPMTVGKFLCHLEEDPTQIAVMRIYYQIPITRTEDANLVTLTQQVQPHEAVALFHVSLVTAKKTQGEYDLVPGGYVKYLVWEKVPGEPLTEEFFWILDPLVRDDIRAKFRVAFESFTQIQDGGREKR